MAKQETLPPHGSGLILRIVFFFLSLQMYIPIGGLVSIICLGVISVSVVPSGGLISQPSLPLKTLSEHE